ncbi:glycosyl hydrolase 115 family protein [Bifidobacterium vespertilionis]|uniref:Alpha-glucuronidase n=1 Tax=Bifidobacterium vespertilionis TaxID=2562524 RepID=A0A5J5E4H4_9BIFI|nr:glycosyl hydrolase 115 family protein [Bifidobacterium vespertilionis]KAA8817030.1 alpha-glucuronidase [Bifidobacterium vespertilionis]KAA8823802.1 alpha-glucuronidase [Bifidobacterium vespertilionis]
MNANLSPGIIVDADLVMIDDPRAMPGVRRVADWVADDIAAVIGTVPRRVAPSRNPGIRPIRTALIYGTIGQGDLIDELAAQSVLDPAIIAGGRERHLTRIVDRPLPGVDRAIVIAGSDKRGTIYGLLRLSELLGVSPLRNWSGIEPARRASVALAAESVEGVSREPSVKYRGFFINDEWPAFGNWSRIHFGGANAECYARVFELLLRLKGNYLWPAMWIDNISLDGPGLKAVELADELGVVMSTSHHEPCMRTGEEYGLMRGPDSPYGDAWDFLANREGITRFWRDGLKRNKPFEKVITMGMRGERDTAIMANATMEENIALIRDVLATQNQLMREEIDPDLAKVPRQLVLFNEVERFFYGDPGAGVPGLADDPELDGVTVMLSDNNVSYMRTLPEERYRYRNGGWGMYYHMDMHGGPASYEWIASTALPRVWDQMSCAWQFGVREIWVVNVGDIATNEMPLAYFLDMAYDMDAYGPSHPNNAQAWLDRWVARNFGDAFGQEDLALIRGVLDDYLLIVERRKHEVMRADTYHPAHYGEAENLLRTCERLLRVCDGLKDRCPERVMPGFIEQVWYPVCGTANLMMAWVLAGRNALYARQNRVDANALADRVADCIRRDREIVDAFHDVGDGRFDGFGLSEHFGFRGWSADNNQYPIRQYVEPAGLPRLIVSFEGSDAYNIGSRWLNDRMTIDHFTDPRVDAVTMTLSCGSREPVRYRIENGCPWLSFSRYQGGTVSHDDVTITIDRTALAECAAQADDGWMIGEFTVVGLMCEPEGGYAVPELCDARVHVSVLTALEVDDGLIVDALAAVPEGTNGPAFVQSRGVIAIEADHAAASGEGADGSRFERIAPYGKTGVAMRVTPATSVGDVEHAEDAPWLEYRFITSADGDYELTWVMAPTLPVGRDGSQLAAMRVNDGPIEVLDLVEDHDRPFYMSPQYTREAIDAVKLRSVTIRCRRGLNAVRFIHLTPNVVLERVVIHPAGRPLPESYLGPTESAPVPCQSPDGLAF